MAQKKSASNSSNRKTTTEASSKSSTSKGTRTSSTSRAPHASTYNLRTWIPVLLALVAIILAIRKSYNSLDKKTAPGDFEDPKPLPGRKPNTTAWEIVDIPSRGGGKGVIATRRIEPGELLMEESPLLKVPTSGGTQQQVLELLEEEVEKLSDEQRVILAGLSDSWGEKWEGMGKWAGILQTNGMNVGSSHLAIFPTIARLNHACAGSVNAVYHWRELQKRQYIHAVKPIEKGEEIFVSYSDTKKFGRSDKNTPPHYTTLPALAQPVPSLPTSPISQMKD